MVDRGNLTLFWTRIGLARALNEVRKYPHDLWLSVFVRLQQFLFFPCCFTQVARNRTFYECHWRNCQSQTPTNYICGFGYPKSSTASLYGLVEIWRPSLKYGFVRVCAMNLLLQPQKRICSEYIG